MKSTILNIKTTKVQKFENIIGNIKKIFINTSEPMHNVSLTFKTNEAETLYKIKLEQPITVIYPWNFLDVQGRGVEYYSHGDLFVEIEGLIEGQEIKQISIFYE